MRTTSHKAFTIVELLIASSILMIIISMSISIFFNISRVITNLDLTTKLDFEAKYILERMVREIKEGTIDYPEYYNYYVLNESGALFATSGDNFGSNYSVYGARFYNPGLAAAVPPAQAGDNFSGLINDDLGTWCQYAPTKVRRITNSLCDDIPSLEDTEDFATGTNPYTGSIPTLPTQASAICDSSNEMSTKAYRDCSFAGNVDAHEVDMLFLMNAAGDTKTILGRELSETAEEEPMYFISMLKMDGTDGNNDGVNELWACKSNFLCTGGTLPNAADLTTQQNIFNSYFDFIPISSPDISITDLRFYIAPIEDPMKAYDEYPEQIQPYITIVMTAELTDPRADTLPVSQRKITLQTTVSTQFYGEIDSYLGTE